MSATQPNILFIVVDDCGYADLGCTGQTDYATPTLDRLASEGVRFTQAYANAPLCTNTRVALITGRYSVLGIFTCSEAPICRRWAAANSLAQRAMGTISLF
jgi:arylsulfatase A-like enzyme